MSTDVIEQSYGLSPVQEGMLFHRLKAPSSGVDVEQMIATLHERLDVASLTCAFEAVVQAHPPLRTRFRWEGLPGPVQEVLHSTDVRIARHDLLGHPETARKAALDAFLREDRIAGFDLAAAPLFRLTVFHFADTEHRFVFSFPHLLLDGGSFPTVVEQVFRAYDALLRGEMPDVRAGRPYSEHIESLEATLPVRAKAARAFFRDQLSGFVAPNQFKVAKGASLGPADRLFGERQVALSTSRTTSLVAFAKAHDVTLNTLVQVAWALVVRDHGGGDDVVFGTVRACRRGALPLAEDETRVGLFINTLPLRVSVHPGARIVDVLAATRKAYVESRPFEHTPLSAIREASSLPRGAPLFSSIVVFNDARMGTRMKALGGAFEHRDFDWIEQTNYPLTLFAYAEPSLLLHLSYDPAGFEGSLVERMLDRLDLYLGVMVEHPGSRVGDLPPFPPRERAALERFDDTNVDVEPTCVHVAFEAQVRRSPEAVALAFRDRALTYRELNARANRLAERLRRAGVGPGTLVALFVGRSVGMVVGLLGILKAGGAYVPCDPHYPKERVRMMLEDSAALVVVTDERWSSRLPTSDAVVVRVDDLDSGDAEKNVDSGVTPEHLAYVMFTSGSTGRPKGVMVEHRQVSNFFAGMDQRLGTAPGVWLAVTSVSFDISVLELFWTLARGFKVVVQEETDRASIASLVTDHGVSSREMEFSLFYFASDAGGAAGDRYRLLLEGARFADAHGFSAVWTPERHFHAFGGLYPNPSVTSAAVAAVTERIQIRAGSVVLPLHNPIRVAEEWAVVDNLSHGRVGLSFASGWHANDFALAPENYADRKEVMLRGIDTVRRLWRGESIAVRSGTGENISVRVRPAPVRAEPPIWLTAAGSVETFRMAGELGANVLTNMLGQSALELKGKLDVYREARRKSGHPGNGHVSLMLHTFIGLELDAVRDMVRAPFTEYLRTSTDLVKRARWYFPAFAGSDKADKVGGPSEDEDLSREDMDALLAHAFERYFETHGLFGTPESCLPMVDRLRAIGVDEIACLIDFGVAENDVLRGLVHLSALVQACNPKRPALTEEDYRIGAQIRRHRVTHLQCTPSLAKILLDQPETMAAMGSLGTLLVGGESLSPSLAADLYAAGFRGELLNMYGPTETTVWSTTAQVVAGEPVTVGTPIVNTQIYVVLPNGARAPIGVAGEIYIGGQGVARGYLNHAELTRERFVPDRFSGEVRRRLYRTFDLGRLREDGKVEHLGRLDHQVKLRGYRIELGEIESVLASQACVREAIVDVEEGPSSDKVLVAYVVPERAPSADDADEWRAIWDDTYRERAATAATSPAATTDATFNVAGWNDSYTGLPISEPEMREWLDATVQRILSRAPGRVLEIGCGTGMLLFRIAPDADKYTGVDFSEEALAHVRSVLLRDPSPHVELVRAAAHELSGVEPGSYDTVILNSVIQYFPSGEYLETVLGSALGALAPGGRVFVGDVRSLPLLDTFHASIEIQKGPPTAARSELFERVRRRRLTDGELAVDPGFFYRFADRDDLAFASVELKRGTHDNELSKFRYDVVLHKKSNGAAFADASPIDGAAPVSVRGDGIATISDVRARLASRPAVCRVSGVLDSRLAKDLHALSLLSDPEGPSDAASLCAALDRASRSGVHPEALYALDDDYDVHVTSSAELGHYDALFVRRGEVSTDRALLLDWLRRRAAPNDVVRPIQSLVHRAVRPRVASETLAKLKEALEERLPDFMVPHRIVLIDRLPLTLSGKVDRKALPRGSVPAAPKNAAFLAPASENERVIADIWRELLGVERVSVNDNFFDLGANSLMVMRANGRIRAALGKNLTLVDMFRFPTTATLSAYLSGERASSVAAPSIADHRRRAESRRDAMRKRRELIDRARSSLKR